MKQFQMAIVTKVEGHWTKNYIGEIIQVCTTPHSEDHDDAKNYMIKCAYKDYKPCSYTKNWRIDWVILEEGKLLNLLAEIL